MGGEEFGAEADLQGFRVEADKKRVNHTQAMEAFHRSANIIVNVKDIDKIDTILQKGLNDTTVFYKIFKEYLVQAGKI